MLSSGTSPFMPRARVSRTHRVLAGIAFQEPLARPASPVRRLDAGKWRVAAIRTIANAGRTLHTRSLRSTKTTGTSTCPPESIVLPHGEDLIASTIENSRHHLDDGRRRACMPTAVPTMPARDRRVRSLAADHILSIPAVMRRCFIAPYVSPIHDVVVRSISSISRRDGVAVTHLPHVALLHGFCRALQTSVTLFRSGPGSPPQLHRFRRATVAPHPLRHVGISPRTTRRDIPEDRDGMRFCASPLRPS